MKKIVRNVALVLGLVGLIATLGGCGQKKTAITSDEFVSMMEGAGYSVFDVTNQAKGMEGIDTVQVALNPDQTYQIEYYKMIDEDWAHGTCDTMIKSLSSKYNTKIMSLNLTTPHTTVSYYTGKGKDADGNKIEAYVHISRIDDTFIFVVADSEYRDEIREMIKTLGY